MKTEIYPAIDMSGGRVVRLLRGDYGKKTIYEGTPAEKAAAFEAAGAKYLHMVDLDGAKDGDTPAFDAVREVTETTSLKVEIGGGIRDEGTIERYLEAGVFRVILGTVAVTEPAFTAKMLAKYGERIAVGIDIRDGYPAIKGWKELSGETAEAAFTRLCEAGAKAIICTDISRDGAMKGIDEAFYRELVQKYTGGYGCGIVASGGVTDREDVVRLSGLGLSGIIIGRALYNGAVDLSDAVRIAEEAAK